VLHVGPDGRGQRWYISGTGVRGRVKCPRFPAATCVNAFKRLDFRSDLRRCRANDGERQAGSSRPTSTKPDRRRRRKCNAFMPTLFSAARRRSTYWYRFVEWAHTRRHQIRTPLRSLPPAFLVRQRCPEKARKSIRAICYEVKFIRRKSLEENVWRKLIKFCQCGYTVCLSLSVFGMHLWDASKTSTA